MEIGLIVDQPVDVARQPYVRLLRRRSDGFVEFVFSIGDPDLGVELILPEKAYAQFCAHNRVRFLSADEARESDVRASKWRFGQVGITE